MFTKSQNKELRNLGLRVYNNKMITEEKNGVIVKLFAFFILKFGLFD